MVEKVKKLGLQLDRDKWVYFVDMTGSVCRILKDGTQIESELLYSKAVIRDIRFLYFVDDHGDVSRILREKIRGRVG